MDWSKAKTILIIGFAITNVILAFVLFANERITEPTIKQKFIDDAIERLENKDISIDTTISKEIPSLNTLVVGYEIIDISEINENFFENKGLINLEEEDNAEIYNGNEYIYIKKKKRLIYENKDRETKYTNLNKELAESIAINFLNDRKLDTNDIKLDHIIEEDNVYYLSFSKIYKKSYLESVQLDIIVDSRGVRKLERMWLDVESEGEIPIYINTAPKAMLNLLSIEEAYGRTVIDMSLCYYFEPEEHEYVKDPQEAKKGKTIPAWRVLFSDGHKLIIDNY